MIDINDTPSVSSPSRRKKRAYGQLRELSYEFPWVVGGIIGEYLIPENNKFIDDIVASSFCVRYDWFAAGRRSRRGRRRMAAKGQLWRQVCSHFYSFLICINCVV